MRDMAHDTKKASLQGALSQRNISPCRENNRAMLSAAAADYKSTFFMLTA